MDVSKRVRVTIEVSESFVRMLQATCQFGYLVGERQKHPMTALDALGIVVLGEARGAKPEQIVAMTPNDWVDDIRAVSDERKVREEP